MLTIEGFGAVHQRASIAAFSLATVLFVAPAACRADVLYVSASVNSVEEFDTVTGTDLGSIPAVNPSLDNPSGLAFDSTGDLYVANLGDGHIDRFAPGGTGTVFATVSTPEGLAFDSAGNLFVSSENPANSSDSTIVKLTSNGTASVFASGLDFPNGLAFDSAGNLYVANTDNSTIMKFASNGTGSLFARTPYPDGLAFDSAGNLYASNIEGGISKFSPTGTGLGTFGTVSGVGEGLAFDSAGNLYVASGQTITRFTPSGAGSVLATGGTLADPQFIAIQPGLVVPEPATWEMAVLGLLALLVLVRPKAKA
jgi:sugar lactone lactonase YvrE